MNSSSEISGRICRFRLNLRVISSDRFCCSGVSLGRFIVLLSIANLSVIIIVAVADQNNGARYSAEAGGKSWEPMPSLPAMGYPHCMTESPESELRRVRDLSKQMQGQYQLVIRKQRRTMLLVAVVAVLVGFLAGASFWYAISDPQQVILVPMDEGSRI
jgi:hypothetical protein